MCCGIGELLALDQHSQSRIAGNSCEQAIVLCSDWGIRQHRQFLAVSGKRILENSPSTERLCPACLGLGRHGKALNNFICA